MGVCSCVSFDGAWTKGGQGGEKRAGVASFDACPGVFYDPFSSSPLTLARRPRMSVLNSLGVVYPTVSGTFKVVAPAC
jgi:hypothetical protein